MTVRELVHLLTTGGVLVSVVCTTVYCAWTYAAAIVSA